MGNSTFPPSFVVSSYSTVRERPIRVSYEDSDLATYVFKVCERVKISKGPSKIVLSVELQGVFRPCLANSEFFLYFGNLMFRFVYPCWI